jgi:uncharacterized protein YndB with AHSA1/START domain
VGKRTAPNAGSMTRPTIAAMTRRAAEGEIRCAGRDFEPFSGQEYRSAPRCENVAEFHWTFRDGSFHQVLCEYHAARANHLGSLTRVTPENPAVVTEAMAMEWGSQEESEQARESWKKRSLAAGGTVMSNGVIYHPDGTTTNPQRMSVREQMAAISEHATPK